MLEIEYTDNYKRNNYANKNITETYTIGYLSLRSTTPENDFNRTNPLF